MRTVNPIILTGFMGTGKTSVGQEVARRLGRPFVDMDAEIERRMGKPIPRIFAEDGEAAFRETEKALCAELTRRAADEGLVIATGGGTLIDPASRTRMMEMGTVICLDCAPDEILRRLQMPGNPLRPLLPKDDPLAEIERLLAMRRAAYASIPWHVDTTHLPPEEVARRVIELGRTITLPVKMPGGYYDVHVGDGLLPYVGGALQAALGGEGGRVAIVSNPIVAPLYSAQVEEGLRAAGFHPFPCTIPDGEAHKTLDTVVSLYDQFLAGGLSRSDVVLSLGGGVTGDVAGFAAATFMRGVRFAQLPTTLLAMIDASVGGKTGVNLRQGKNLAGAFHHPVLVLIDPTVLRTLPPEQVRSGLAEMIKHGVVGAPELFAELEAAAGEPLRAIQSLPIAQALRVKILIVEADPFEQGRRAVLNLGHTVGHALEKLSAFTLRHGEAVSIGMVAAARIAVELGLADPSLAGRIEAVLAAWGLPVRLSPYTAAAVWEAMSHDKKRKGLTLRWALPRALGEVEVVEHVPPSVVLSVLKGMEQ